MSERKAINKYYPPDWDPSKLPKVKKNPNAAIKVRLLAPFSMRCLNCNEYISSNRKFNAKKQVTDEKYLEVKIIQFEIRCPICNNVILFKTQPQSGGFALVSGAKRNFEPTKGLNVPKNETADEILERLMKEDEENKKFQEQQEKRKKNKFWKDNNANDLNEKLLDQQKQVEINDHLEYLQAKNRRLMENENKITTQGIVREEDDILKDKIEVFNKYKAEKTQSEPKPEKRILPQPQLILKKVKPNITKKQKTEISEQKIDDASKPTEPSISGPLTEAKGSTEECLRSKLVDYSSSDEE